MICLKVNYSGTQFGQNLPTLRLMEKFTTQNFQGGEQIKMGNE